LPSSASISSLVFAPLASGSRGNCTYVGDGRFGLLIDCGISTKQIFARLEEIGLGDAPIDAVFITHEHSDHVGAAGVLSRALQRRNGVDVPFYMTGGTARSLSRGCIPDRIAELRPGREIAIGDLSVQAYAIPHDVAEPVAFAVTRGDVRVGVVTDLGHATPLVRQLVGTLDAALLEFNHDLDMLRSGPYTWSLQERIRGARGHLSNTQAAELLTSSATPRLKHLVLAHLSEENNTPEIAAAVAHQALGLLGLSGVRVQVAQQDRALAPLFVQGRERPSLVVVRGGERAEERQLAMF